MSLNQRALARLAKVSQTTISLALRGDPSIPRATCERIRKLADARGYRKNPSVASLMAQIRRNRRPRAGGCIALLVDAANDAGWLTHDYTRRQYEGIKARAVSLGFRTEVFYLRADGMSPPRIHGILRARGIRGILLAGRKQAAADLTAMRWQDYACVTISYTWDWPPVDRVSSHHRHNMDIVLRLLQARGYRRIGLSLQPRELAVVDQNWLSGFLIMNRNVSARQRVPLFVAEHEARSLSKFSEWLKKCKPDALVTLNGWEQVWMDGLGVVAPRDLGFVCLNRPTKTHIAGIEENHEMIGATAIELLVAQMQRNEYGLPAHPRLTLINGEWRDGVTVRS